MAIDTTAKRASASNFLLPFYNGVVTDGAMNIDETVAASWMYNGISIAQIAVLTPISETTINFNLYIDQARGFTSYIDQAINFDLEL